MGSLSSLETELRRQALPREAVLSIGVFDGVHRGHKHLLSRLKEKAKEQGLLPAVVTFDRHPSEVLSVNGSPPQLMALADRLALLKGLGLEVILLTFTPQMAQVKAVAFLSLLQQYLRMKGLVVGTDFALGHGREGNVSALPRLSQEMGFSLEVVPPLKLGGKVVSSTAIRQALDLGDMARVRRLLSHPFTLRGRVVVGAARGKLLGFPTANLALAQDQALPADGVYASLAYLDSKAMASVTNVGTSPTFNGQERKVEVHIFDFDQELYQKMLRVEFITRLREERKFDSPEELRSQMERDVIQARELLAL